MMLMNEIDIMGKCTMMATEKDPQINNSNQKCDANNTNAHRNESKSSERKKEKTKKKSCAQNLP